MALAHRAKVKDPAKAFISTWRTSTVYTGSTANNQIKLPLEVAGTYKFTVQWGDGTSNLITVWNQAETTHTYPAPGDYTVTITGFIKGWDFGQGGTVAPTTGDMRKLLTITQFGCLRLVTHLDPLPLQIWGTFYGCTNLSLSAVTDMPNFKGTISTHGFLRGAAAITTINNINKWDVSKIQIFRSMFREIPLFNDNIGNWNTKNATNFITFFFMPATTVGGLGIFNNGGSPSINNWDTSNVTNMANMFTGQRLFNQPVGNWDTSKVTSMGTMFYASNVSGYPGLFNQDISNWNTGNVTTMAQMFQYQSDFNQNIGNWDVSKVTTFQDIFVMSFAIGSFNNGGSSSINNWNTNSAINMRRMFRNQLSFNQPIGNWNVSLVNNLSDFMQGKTNLDYSAANYDTLLIGWASRPVQPNISINFNTIKYTAAASAARAILTSAPNNWTIVDGGLLP